MVALTGSDPPPIATAMSWDAQTWTATFTLAGGSGLVVPTDGNYRATLAEEDVTNAAGEGIAADAVVDFFVLAGDANRDRWVDISDLSILATNWRQPPCTFS